MRLTKYMVAMLAAGAISLTCTGTSRAGLDFSGSSGTLAADATFVLTGNTLTVTLTNTSLTSVSVPADVLTGVFFNTNPGGLTPMSATLPSGAAVHYGSISNAGDGWGYGDGVSAQGENSAISTTGAVNGLGHSNFSSASNALDGLGYGIASAGGFSNPNTGITGHGPIIQNSVVFTLTAATGFSLSELGNQVVFQYGTSLSEPSYSSGPPTPYPPPSATPEPSTMLIAALGAIGFLGYGLRRRKTS